MPHKSMPLLASALIIIAALGTLGSFMTPSGFQSVEPSSGPLIAAGVRPDVPIFHCRVMKEYPHDPEAFTQGLVYADGFLYESTGLHGRSSLRQVELETGKVLRKYSLPQQFFGEGLAAWKDRLIQLTWQSRVGFVYGIATFQIEREFHYATEGWGLAHDEESLIMSDGTETLRFLDPGQLKEVRRISVQDRGAPVRYLNELEYVKGEIYANVWQSDYVIKISPRTGDVLGWIDLSRLKRMLGSTRNVDVLNGIAYDAAHNRIFVTGKLWPKLFEIEIIPMSP